MTKEEADDILDECSAYVTKAYGDSALFALVVVLCDEEETLGFSGTLTLDESIEVLGCFPKDEDSDSDEVTITLN
jgi:hypothetical protein